MTELIKDNEEFRGRMTVEVEHLYERLGDIEGQLIEVKALVTARIDGHERYHESNEHRWGLVKWCHLYPFRLVAVLASLSVAFSPDVRDPVLMWMLRILKSAGGW